MARVLRYSEGISRNLKMFRPCFVHISFCKTTHAPIARRNPRNPFWFSMVTNPAHKLCTEVHIPHTQKQQNPFTMFYKSPLIGDIAMLARSVSFRQGCVRRADSSFFWGQEAADGGSADLELACDFGFADSLPM